MNTRLASVGGLAIVVCVLIVTHYRREIKVETTRSYRMVGNGANDFFLPTQKGYLTSTGPVLKIFPTLARNRLEASKNVCMALGGLRCAGVTWFNGPKDTHFHEIILRTEDIAIDTSADVGMMTALVKDPTSPPLWRDPTYDPPLDMEILQPAQKVTKIDGTRLPNDAGFMGSIAVQYCRFLGRDTCKRFAHEPYADRALVAFHKC